MKARGVNLTEKALGMLRKLTSADRHGDKMGADRFYFLVIPQSNGEAFTVNAIGFKDDQDADARKRFVLQLAGAVKEHLIKEGLLTDEKPAGGGESDA